MPDESIYGFGSTDVQRIGAAVSFVERDPRYTLRKRKYPIGGGGGSAIVEGVLTSAISPSSNSITSPTTFTFHQLTGDGTGELDEGEENETGYNRFTTVSAETGSYVQCAKNNGVWILINVDPACQ